LPQKQRRSTWESLETEERTHILNQLTQVQVAELERVLSEADDAQPDAQVQAPDPAQIELGKTREKLRRVLRHKEDEKDQIDEIEKDIGDLKPGASYTWILHKMDKLPDRRTVRIKKELQADFDSIDKGNVDPKEFERVAGLIANFNSPGNNRIVEGIRNQID